MDHRYGRPQDRPFIHNPNHSQPPPSQPAPGPSYGPSQPSYQIPASDPFQRRVADPFMPQPQTQRRNSYGRIPSAPGPQERTGLGAPWSGGSQGSNNSSISGPPPPPALSQALGVQDRGRDPYAPEHTRRRSIGSGHSPRGYYANVSSAEPPPPPTAFMSRHMPPPSPSQQPLPGPASAYQPGARGPPPPPTFSRELPGLGSRGPGSGMSISSILGDGPAAPPGAGQSLSQSPPSANQQPVSPHRRGHSMTSKLGDYPSWRRPHTPDQRHLPAGLRAESTSYSANSSPAHFASMRRSPEFQRSGPPLFPPPYQSAGGPQRFQGSPPNERDVLGGRQEERIGIPPRPNSQPAGLAGPPPHQEERREIIPSFGIRPPFGYGPPERREDPRMPVTSAYEPRDRPMTVEPLGQPSYSPRKDPRDPLPPKEDLRRDEPPFRAGFRQYNYQPRNVGPAGGPPPEAPRSHPQMGNPFDRPPRDSLPPQDRAIPSIDPLARDDRRTSDPNANSVDPAYRHIMGEHTAAPMMMQRSRSSIGLEEMRKRGSRASPMPQAVQGAQMQPRDHGADPGIKSEFGRIFQGLGMGSLGGSMTPTRGSPMPGRTLSQISHPDGGDAIVLSDGEGGAGMVRSASKRHNKRVKEEGAYGEEDGRGTPLGGARAGKRAKAGHAGHHHHMHQHNHPHHHHIHGHAHRPEEIAGPSSAAAHHHHHIHTSHHHHHSPLAPRAQPQTPVAPMPKPTLTISSSPVLASVKDKTRRHLGSEVYNPIMKLPPSAMAQHSYDPFGYYLSYKPSRSFDESDLNCTFTVRVPRYYLQKENLENVVKNGNVTGTEICTDDSDPVGMAVHAGWMRGEWPDDVDVEMLDIPTSNEQTLVEEDYEAPPSAPVVAPEGKDLQITLLILPALKKYQGAVRFGMKSRDWDNSSSSHDGLSWMVHKIRWVDEASSSGVQRSGAARRERIDNQHKEAALALVGLAGMGKAVAVA